MSPSEKGRVLTVRLPDLIGKISDDPVTAGMVGLMQKIGQNAVKLARRLHRSRGSRKARRG
jgi:hypothetical protein